MDFLKNRHQNCIVCGSAELRLLPEYRRIELARCERCSLVFTPWVPTESELQAHYREYTRESTVSAVSARRREELLQRFEKYRRSGRFLDVGCGVGDLLNQAAAHGWETYGTEFTADAVEICAANGHRIHTGVLDPSNYASVFDVIVYSEVIEHITNQADEFRRAFSLLRPGGLLYVTTPNFSSLSRRLLRDRWPLIQYPEHLAYFTPPVLVDLMQRVGFQVVRITNTGFSLSRLRAGLLRRSAETTPGQRARSGDETVRRALERPFLRPLKYTINALLDALALGDTIKAEFVRPL